MTIRLSLIAATAAGLLSAACSGGGDVSAPADAIVSVGSRHLTRADLLRALPTGVNPDDSVTLARTYIRSWLDEALIEDVAAAEVDMAEVERLTEEYRRSLIMTQYRRAMAAKASDGIFAEDSLRAYYTAHADDFILERPLIKGVYLKVADDSRNLPALRKLYKSEKPDDFDRLEKHAIGSAIHYDYFRDRWVDWEQVETRIPMEFDAKALADIAARKPLEVSAGGFTYLLCVSEYLPAGSPMPFEAALPIVRERMLSIARLDYDKRLRNALLNRAINDGTITFHGANPLK